MPNYERIKTDTGQWETDQAKAARIKREINAENDALGLKLGDWVKVSRYVRRLASYHLDRKKPIILSRPTVEEIEKAEAQEKRTAELRAKEEERKAWRNQPHVCAANQIRFELECELATVIERLTPAEWIALRDRILPRGA